MNTHDQALARENTTEQEVYAKAHAGAVLVLLLPLGWLVLFGLLIVRARLHLGFWPHSSRGQRFGNTWEPSPVDPSYFELHYDLLLLGILPAACGLIVCLLILVVSAFAPSLRRSPKLLAGVALVGASTLGLVTVGVDLLEWAFG